MPDAASAFRKTEKLECRTLLLQTSELMTRSEILFRRHPGNPILTAAGWPYPANSVFNPGADRRQGLTRLLVRVEDHRGISHLTLASSRDGLTDWRIDPEPTFAPSPDHPEEAWGVEDPRIAWLEEEERYAVAYTAYSPAGPLVSLALSTDLRSYQRLGAVLPPENKDAALFARRVGGRWAMIHRPVPGSGGGANIWIAYSHDLRHWGGHQVLLRAREGAWWDSGKIGLNAPPLETPRGWLILYHGVRQTGAGCLYRLGLALLDLQDPARVLARGDQWVFGPREPYETSGDVGNVVFPCGWTLDESNGDLRIYYGAADSCVGLATARLSQVLDFLQD